MNEFNNFVDYLQDKIFEETSLYLNDVVGSNEWDEELHQVHGIIMWNAVEAIAKKMGINKEK
jgi:hypothetical protein